MPLTKHRIINRHAFSTAEPKGAWRLPSDVRPELMSQNREADLTRLDELIAAFKNPAQTAKRAVDAGIESATGDQEKIEAANRKHAKQLTDPVRASHYIASQRLARNLVLRSRRI